jgi:hypothetical protein
MLAHPYDLRHSHISLLIAQGATVIEVARQAGHAPTMTLSTYAHLFDEHDEGDRGSAEKHIRAARLAETTPEVSVLCRRPGPPTPRKKKSPDFQSFCRALHRTRTDDPFLTMEVLYQLS